MKPTSIILLSIAAFFGIKMFAKTGAAQRLQFFVQKVNLRFQDFTPIVDIILGIQNPSGESLRIGSIVGELYINGNYAANISGFQLTDIKGLGTSFFPISARLSVSGVVNQIVDLVNGVAGDGLTALANQNLLFKGFVNAEGFTTPLNFTYKVL